jgi:hypothetical protein
MPKRFIVTINSDGSISAESTGQQGLACLDDVSTIQAMCDFAVVVDSKLTPEYYGGVTISPDLKVHNVQQIEETRDQ